MKKAIIYARVSTERQADEDASSIEEQIIECKKHIANEGWRLVGEFSDAVSGFSKSYDERFGIHDAIASLKEDNIDYFVCDRPDRFGRDLGVSIRARGDIKETGAKLIIVSGNFDSDSDEGRLFLNLTASFADYDAAKTKAKMRRGKEGAAKLGHVQRLGGHCPFGYKFEDKTLAIVESDAETVQDIFNLYTSKDISIRGVAKYLTDKKIPTYRDRKNGSSKLTKWGNESVRHILNNETYAGKFQYQPDKTKDKFITLDVPAIVDYETFKKAKARLDYNASVKRSQPKIDNPYRGRIKCDKCGGSVTLIRRKSRSKKANQPDNIYFKCSRSNKSSDLCDAGSFNGRVLTSAIREQVLEYANSPKQLRKKLEKYSDTLTKKNAPMIKRVNSLQARVNDLMKQRSQAVTVATVDTSPRTLETLSQITSTIDEQLDALILEKAELEVSIKHIPLLDLEQYEKYWTQYLKFVGSLTLKENWGSELYESFAPKPQALLESLFTELDVRIKVGRDTNNDPYAILTTSLDMNNGLHIEPSAPASSSISKLTLTEYIDLNVTKKGGKHLNK